jgi:hypothetical protein
MEAKYFPISIMVSNISQYNIPISLLVQSCRKADFIHEDFIVLQAPPH